jgi:hypothetical protein
MPQNDAAFPSTPSTNMDRSQLHKSSSPSANVCQWDGVADTEEWQLACRIASSRGFCKSELLPKFLLYVCEETLLSNGHRITEQHIGTQIFKRPTDYSPGEDNIVRSYARTLRKRLDDYFDSEGRDEPLRLVIPRGGYVPSFSTNAPSFSANAPSFSANAPSFSTNAPSFSTNAPSFSANAPSKPAVPRESSPDALATHKPEVLHPFKSAPTTANKRIPPTGLYTSRHLWLTAMLCLATGFALGIAGGWVFHAWQQRAQQQRAQQQRAQQQLAHPLWAESFHENKSTRIVPVLLHL